MVFTQSNVQHPHNILKVVDLNNLKPEKANDSIGNSIGGDGLDSSQPLHLTTLSYSEVYLKPEPLSEDTMFNENDCEFFQDLMHWCSDSAEVEPKAIDPPKKREEITHNTDTLHTTVSSQSWDVFDANSPAQAGFYSSTLNAPLSPNMDGFNACDNIFLYNTKTDDKSQQIDQNLDILNLPVVLGNLASEEMVDLNTCPTTVTFDYYNSHTTQSTEYTSIENTHKMFLHTVDEEDSLDLKLGSVIMGEVENVNVGIFNSYERQKASTKTLPTHHLTLNVSSTPAMWPGGNISTPEVLSYVEQLEKEKCSPIVISTTRCSTPDPGLITIDSCLSTTGNSFADYKPVLLKSESHEDSDVDEAKNKRRRKRSHSEDSDETYTPYEVEKTPRKYKKRKPNVPIKDMILALEESQQLPKARRGRPPKRRESNVSSACSVDDNSSCASTHKDRYRDLRDKNNEASKRSRMNRKLKELQMEQLVVELEERNKKLQIKANILEDMTKRLKDALMTAIIQK